MDLKLKCVSLAIADNSNKSVFVFIDGDEFDEKNVQNKKLFPYV